MLVRLTMWFLLTTACCWGQTETAATARLSAEFKEAYRYVPPAPVAGKPETNGESGAESEPLVGPRSAPQAEGWPETRPAAATNRVMRIPRLSREIMQVESLRPTGQTAASGVESAPKAPRPQPAGQGVAHDPGSEVMILPEMEVTARKETALGVKLAEIDRQQRSLAKDTEPSWLDSLLNPSFFSLGGASANTRAATARRRLEVLGWVRAMTISLEQAKSPEEQARIQADIDGLKEIMRSWQ